MTGCPGVKGRINPRVPHWRCCGNAYTATCAHYRPYADSLAPQMKGDECPNYRPREDKRAS